MGGDGTGSGSCPVVGIWTSNVEPLDFPTSKLINQRSLCFGLPSLSL